jgi:hypothetical protein
MFCSRRAKPSPARIRENSMFSTSRPFSCDQPRADHGQHARAPRRCPRNFRRGVAIVRRDVDEEEVRQVRRQAARQSASRSLRTTASSSSTMMPSPNATIWMTLSPRTPAEVGDAVAPGHADRAAQPEAARTSSTPGEREQQRRTREAHPHEAREDLQVARHPPDEDSDHAATAGPKASQTSGGGGPTSRRSTRIAGTRDSCSSGGSAKPPSTAISRQEPEPGPA